MGIDDMPEIGCHRILTGTRTYLIDPVIADFQSLLYISIGNQFPYTQVQILVATFVCHLLQRVAELLLGSTILCLYIRQQRVIGNFATQMTTGIVIVSQSFLGEYRGIDFVKQFCCLDIHT